MKQLLEPGRGISCSPPSSFATGHRVRVLLIRHGHTNSGEDFLSEKGHKQASALAEYLVQLDCSSVYYSGIESTEQTLDPLRWKRPRALIRSTESLEEIEPFYAMGRIEPSPDDIKRIHGLLQNLLDESCEDDCNVLISHCHLIRYLLTVRNLRFLDPGRNRTLDEMQALGLVPSADGWLSIDYGSISSILIDSLGGISLEFINNMSHLPDNLKSISPDLN
jgi:broad specificity phosphatase PhoE